MARKRTGRRGSYKANFVLENKSFAVGIGAGIFLFVVLLILYAADALPENLKAQLFVQDAQQEEPIETPVLEPIPLQGNVLPDMTTVTAPPIPIPIGGCDPNKPYSKDNSKAYVGVYSVATNKSFDKDGKAALSHSLTTEPPLEEKFEIGPHMRVFCLPRNASITGTLKQTVDGALPAGLIRLFKSLRPEANLTDDHFGYQTLVSEFDASKGKGDTLKWLTAKAQVSRATPFDYFDKILTFFGNTAEADPNGETLIESLLHRVSLAGKPSGLQVYLLRTRMRYTPEAVIAEGFSWERVAGSYDGYYLVIDVEESEVPDGDTTKGWCYFSDGKILTYPSEAACRSAKGYFWPENGHVYFEYVTDPDGKLECKVTDKGLLDGPPRILPENCINVVDGSEPQFFPGEEGLCQWICKRGEVGAP